MSTNKLRLAVTGQPNTPKLFNALQIAYGLCGSWSKILTVGSSSTDGQFQHLGGYNTLRIAADATPSRYAELLSIAVSCGKDVVVFTSLSNEWEFGVQHHLHGSYFEDVLRSHRMLFHTMKHLPVHVIGCVDTRTIFLQKDIEGRRKLRQERMAQQPDIADHFTTVLHLDKRGSCRVQKDSTKVLPTDVPFKLSLHHGALLANWCRSGEPVISWELQQQIDNCSSLAELYQLLFETDIENVDVITAFTRRRLQLDEERKEPVLELVPGGLL